MGLPTFYNKGAISDIRNIRPSTAVGTLDALVESSQPSGVVRCGADKSDAEGKHYP